MGHKFADILFTDTVQHYQELDGSRDLYANWSNKKDSNYLLDERTSTFIRERDSCYMASISESGWPYVQHRGGPQGFIRVLDDRTIGFADYRGNRQYVSVGNVHHDNRVSLIFVDYPNRRRLKMLGRASLIESQDQALLTHLADLDYAASVTRGILIHVEAYDWNCPQHITPRYDLQQARAIIEAES